MGGIFSGATAVAAPEVEHDPAASSHPLETIGFGPSGQAHGHEVLHPENFKQVADISRKPGDVPPPVKRPEPKTIQIKLTAREVIAEIAPGIRYPYWTFNDRVPCCGSG
ncbi:cupredoxin domain-containing protein [Methylohalobius crimeensis]|uniref:hypothetical protein n=1 Tax=Methylohalobius crimeensis TaxID=244365 RepID=UPI0004207E6A|nr:hypothetical protein [Methylohalobius crimeensis]